RSRATRFCVGYTFTYYSVLKAMAYIFRKHELMIEKIWHRDIGKTRAKSFLIWRIIFGEVAPK
ncbi:hypothetical protein, partial [Porphyromonas loveana]|uniref:hypothetical protein n=1 Tax=Porphyromonas loveana TaxID=1884669 RepID=UPI0035A0D842